MVCWGYKRMESKPGLLSFSFVSQVFYCSSYLATQGKLLGADCITVIGEPLTTELHSGNGDAFHNYPARH